MARRQRKHQTATQFDWGEVLSIIRSHEGLGEAPGHAKAHSFARLQRFLIKNCPGWTPEERNRLRDNVIEIAKQFNLGWRSAVRLALSLSRLAFIHATGRLWEAQPSPAAILKVLDQLEKPVNRLASFWSSSDRTRDLALSSLVRSGGKWASKQQIEKLRRFGFTREKFRIRESGVEGIDHSEREVVHSWFEFAPLILEFIRDAARDARSSGPGLALLDEEESAQESLVGRQLPELYERVTGRPYGVSKIADQVNDTTGVKFVRMALAALGLPELTPETVSFYRKRQKRRLHPKRRSLKAPAG